jgi:membrane protein implicated in regulation of membrane protease activity
MLTDFGFISIRWIWVALTIVFALIEVFTLGLTTLWFALAALIMVFLSSLPIPVVFQVVIFLFLSALFLIFTRPIAVKKLKVGREKTNVDSLIGQHALVIKPISEFEKGEIKIKGQIWSARSEDNSGIAEGTKCEVLRIEGVQAVVRPLPGGSAGPEDAVRPEKGEMQL